ncbi:MAG: CBS domain-containing protein [Myxococcales bacterium]|nr:CBS domain-containing protein [Myxococcales bacterium]
MGKTVADIMTTELIVLQEEDNLAALEPEMEAFGLRHLPVLDGDKLVGLISHRDVLRLATSRLSADPVHASIDRQTAETFVAAVMQTEVLTIGPDSPVSEAARIMVDRKIGCLPVVAADGKLLGIVTEHDLLREIVREAS